MAIYQLGDLIPQIDPTAFIFDSADIIGDVVIEAGASVWANCSIRGDNTRIHVGKGSNIQEGSVLHVDPDTPLVIEEHVTIGHQAMLHGCTIASGSLIGMQAIVLNNAKIGRNCLIGSLAAGDLDKLRTADGFAGARHARGAKHQVHVDAADNANSGL